MLINTSCQRMMSLALYSFPFSERKSRFKTLWIELGLRLNPFDAKLMRDNTLFKSFGATSVTAFRELAPIINTINSSSSSNMNSVVHTRGLESSVSRFIKQFYFCTCSPYSRTLVSKCTCCSHCIARISTRRILKVVVSSQNLLLNQLLTHSQVDMFGT